MQDLEVVLEFAACRRPRMKGLLRARPVISTDALEEVEAVLGQRQDRRALAVNDGCEGVDKTRPAKSLDVALGRSRRRAARGA